MLIVCPACASEYRLEAGQIGPEGRRVRCSGCKTDWLAFPQDDPTPELATAQQPDTVEHALDAQWREAALHDPDVAAALAAHEAREGVAAIEGSQVREPADATEAVSEPAEAADAPSGTGSEADVAQGKPERAGKGERGQARKGGRRFSMPVMPRKRPSRAGIAAAIGLVALGLGLWRREAITRHVPALAGPLALIGLPVNIRGAEFENASSELINDPAGRFLIVQSQIRNVTGRAIPVAPVEIVLRDATGKAIYTWAAEPAKLQLQPGETMGFRTRLAQPPQEAHDVQLRFQRGSAQMAQATK